MTPEAKARRRANRKSSTREPKQVREERLNYKNDFGKPDPTPYEAVIEINKLWEKANTPADQAEA